MAGVATTEELKEEEGGEVPEEDPRPLRKILREFVDSDDAKETKILFSEIMAKIGENPEGKIPYQLFPVQNDAPRVKTLCQTLDSKMNSKEYQKEARGAIKDKKAVVVGGGPCGLRAAIELALLGMDVVVVEKRDAFTRNSVLQLWSFLVEDLKRIGFKELLPKFGLGDRLHISIRRLQLVLLKIALIMGVDVHLGVEFIKLIEPKKKKVGWKGHFFNISQSLVEKSLADFEFEALVVGSGRQQEDLGGLGFEWVNIERKLAIAIAANFKNNNSRKDLQVDGLGTQGVMHQLDYFTKMKEEKGADLENVVYLRDDTHYFVMTAKRDNLLERGVLKKDASKKTLLDKANVDQEKLQEFAKDVASYCTEEKVPLEFSERHGGGGPDVDIFEFTSRSHAKEAAIVRDVKGKKPLFIALVGDTLKQPFWPEGVGIAHGFFSVFDTVWAVYEFLGEQLSREEVLANRKETYSCIKELSKESMLAVKDYGIDPHKRYGKYRHYKATKDEEKNRPSTSKTGQKAEEEEMKSKDKKVKFDTDKKGKKKKEKKNKEGDGEEKLSFFARFTSFFSRSSKKGDERDGGAEQPPEAGELKRSASADDIRVDPAGEAPPRRRRFDSLRRSIRRIKPRGQKKNKKEKEEQEKTEERAEGKEADVEDEEETGEIGMEHTTVAEVESSGSSDSPDVKIEVRDAT